MEAGSGEEPPAKEQKPKKEKKQAEDGKKPEAAPSEGAKKAKPEENKGKAPPAAQEQPKKLDFITALKATNTTDELPKKTHAQLMKESLGALGA
jgi:hypothetical protein